MKLNKIFVEVLVLFFGACSITFAQVDTLTNDSIPQPQTKSQPARPAAAPKKATGSGNVLDFEGEVIEGERRRPDLFLQMSIDNVKFDSLIYQRDDFNDYLEVDRKSRTRYLKLK